MATIVSNNLLVNGLRTEFADTYGAIRNRQSDSRLGMVMDLSVPATNRDHDFAYLNAAPHIKHWPRGESVPTSAMDSVQFNVKVHEWARRVPWSKWDRKDDQTSSLVDMARMAGESAALLDERIFFDLLTASATNLPAVPNAPDGVAMFSATDGDSADRFGFSGGNIVTKDGVLTTHDVLVNYYECLSRFMEFQDGQGQPLLSAETVDAGVVIIHSAGTLEIFEETFVAKRTGIGMDVDGAKGGTVVAGTTPTNVVHDSSRNVTLWPTSRLTTDDEWYIFLKAAPKKPTFILDREGVQEFSSLEGDNNGDHTRDTAEEYIQWERRVGGGIALPFGAIKVA